MELVSRSSEHDRTYTFNINHNSLFLRHPPHTNLSWYLQNTESFLVVKHFTKLYKDLISQPQYLWIKSLNPRRGRVVHLRAASKEIWQRWITVKYINGNTQWNRVLLLTCVINTAVAVSRNFVTVEHTKEW